MLDRAIMLRFAAPASATGEDLVELHVHGGRAVQVRVMRTILELGLVRAAEPGEFTRRAFENGRIDLIEAEALADLLTAETEWQRRQAVQGVEGHVSRQVREWRRRVLEISALLEARIDFSDEDDVDAAPDALAEDLLALAEDVGNALRQPRIDILQRGLRVVIAGPPNAGKSTLINRLAGEDIAITSTIAGTTRDLIERSVIAHGRAFRLIDTAGLHARSADPVEAIGMARAQAAIETADLVLWLGDEPPSVGEGADRTVWCQPRADEPGRDEPAAGRDIAFSALSGIGVDQLWKRLVEAHDAAAPSLDWPTFNDRQRSELGGVEDALARARAQSDMLLIAEELRHARTHFDRLIGETGVEDMLDTLFGRFCIGK